MIGDFELPGDENANPGKVGGNGPGGSGTQPNQGQKTPQISVPGLPGLPSAMGVPGGQGGLPGLPPGGGLGIDPAQQGAGLPQIPNPLGGAGAGGGQQAGQPPGQQGGQQGGAQGGGQPGGAQVGGLQGETAAGNNPAGAPDGKPSAVTIGDSAMRIEPTPGMAGATGANAQQQAGNTQHHEKGTGTGGRAPTGVQSGNRVEKGRAIPAGL